MSKELAAVKVVLYGDPDHHQEPNQEQIQALYKAVFDEDIIPSLIKHLGRYEFEAKKDVALIFNNVLRRQVGTQLATVEYVAKRPDVLRELVLGHGQVEVALNCGAMLRECVKHEQLARLVLAGDEFYRFFQYVELSNFDVASDAFSTLKDLLTKHKTLCADFLEKHYDRFFERYTALLNSVNYVTKRQSLKLLGELLLDRANFNVMTRYIGSQENLKLMMGLLRDKSRSIQYEAFHVFKVFVANPNKTRPILDILVRNKDKLVAFLQTFHNDNEDEQFSEEKAFLLKQIAQLQPPAP